MADRAAPLLWDPFYKHWEPWNETPQCSLCSVVAHQHVDISFLNSSRNGDVASQQNQETLYHVKDPMPGGS